MYGCGVVPGWVGGGCTQGGRGGCTQGGRVYLLQGVGYGGQACQNGMAGRYRQGNTVPGWPGLVLALPDTVGLGFPACVAGQTPFNPAFNVPRSYFDPNPYSLKSCSSRRETRVIWPVQTSCHTGCFTDRVLCTLRPLFTTFRAIMTVSWLFSRKADYDPWLLGTF